MKANNNTPAIRFAGYTAPWERRKLGDLASILGGYAWKSSDYHKDGDYLVVTIANVTGDVQIRTDIGNRINCPNPGAYRLNENDILISLTGNVGRVSRVPNVNAVLNQRVAKLCPDTRVTDKFLFQTIRNPKFEQAMLDAGQGAAQKNISNSDVLGYEVGVPIEAEQHKLGQVFEQIESLVTLHQRKYEKLVNLKNAMLDKMFPKNGELVPEVRFAGFSGNWERRKLGEIVNRVVRKNTDNASSLALTISAQHGLVDQGNYFNNRVASQDVSNYYLIRKGEFAYNKSSSDGSPFGVVKRLDLYDMGVLSTLYIVFEIKDPNSVNTDYLSVFFDTNRWHKEVSTRASEGARNHGLLNISATDFLDIEINVPREYDEQEKLGEFFMKLAHLIDRYEQGLMSLRNLKSAFLDKMFV